MYAFDNIGLILIDKKAATTLLHVLYFEAFTRAVCLADVDGCLFA